MADTTLPDIFGTPQEMRTAYNDLLVTRKVNRHTATTASEARRRAIAQWGNLVDGLLLRLTDQASGAARNVRVYGALGDGVTDDTAAIQAAIDAVDDAGGGVVFFPLGDYVHTGFTPAAGVRLVYLVSGSPEGVLSGSDGDIAVRIDGGVPIYVKGGTGFDATGWAAIGGGGGDVELADLPDATALSVLGRAANSVGDYADIVAGTDGHVMRRSSDALAFGTLVAGSFATGPGIVTPAMLDNGSARSILGRAANSSGARADIPGAGDRTILSDDASTLAFRTLSQLGIPHTVASGATEVDTGAAGSTDEIDFVSITVPANTLVANGDRLVIEQVGDLLNTSGAQQLQWRLYLGDDETPVLSDNLTYNASTSARRAFVFTTVIYSAGATQQVSMMRMHMSTLNPNAPNEGQFGQIDGASFMGGPVRGNDSSADRTADMTLRITIQLNTAAATHRVRQQGFTVRFE